MRNFFFNDAKCCNLGHYFIFLRPLEGHLAPLDPLGAAYAPPPPRGEGLLPLNLAFSPVSSVGYLQGNPLGGLKAKTVQHQSAP